MDDLLNQALEAGQESERVDFKGSFDVSFKGDWCEIIKDIVAMANSGGGVLLIGVDDSGKPSGFDVTKVLEIDPADVTNKLFGFTGKHFGNFAIITAQKSNQIIAAIVIGPTTVPLVFVKTGDYQDRNGKQKQAFANGMVYYRHGAKSEPCTSDDLQSFVERQIEVTRELWLGNIRKVVEAPQGAQIIVVQAGASSDLANNNIQAIRLVDDPNAPVHQMLDSNRTHPLRGKDVIELVNSRLDGKAKINSHDMLAVRRIHETDNIRRFYYRPLHGIPLYSNQFVDWLVEQFEKDASFFQSARMKYHEIIVEQNQRAERKQR